jgi:hypothetical protein
MPTNLRDSSIPCAQPLPLTAEGITAAWLSEALRTRYPGVVVDQVEPLQIIDGTATKVRLRLAYGPCTRRDGPVRGCPRKPHSRTAVLIPHVSTMTMNLRESSIAYAHPLPLTAEGKACRRTPFAGWIDCVRVNPSEIEVSDE